uniref:G-protein coupled receptors family 1 profile domain-containing protein n=1 Tax=Pygocentrus nattereri TaxID=42514 RepID=A0AAR2KZ21_PYGNA
MRDTLNFSARSFLREHLCCDPNKTKQKWSTLSGVILNVLVIIVTLRHRQLRQPLNYALVNLAVADLGCAMFGGLPTTVTNAMGYFSLGRLGCVLEGFAVAFFGIAGLCSVAVIAIDRYMVVCRPMGTVIFQTRHAVAGVVFSWVWSFVWNTPPLFGWGSYQLEGVMTSCAPDWYSRDTANVSYILCYFMLCFALPFSTIVFSYSRLLWTLRQVETCSLEAEMQVARMVVVMVLAFLLTWLPYASFALAVIFDSNLYINPLIATVPMYLAKSSTVFNPIIYIFMNRQVSERETTGVWTRYHLKNITAAEYSIIMLTKGTIDTPLMVPAQ